MYRVSTLHIDVDYVTKKLKFEKKRSFFLKTLRKPLASVFKILISTDFIITLLYSIINKTIFKLNFSKKMNFHLQELDGG